ncbi:MAG: hypothetical protein II937_07495 [Bacteroidales bacterium]|nr:hypothetical protein [Bacteroidales bacterium]
MKKSIFIASLSLISSVVFAQDEYDALRFSQTYQQGTARSIAMGGAFGALGGDISCLSSNPAGMSIYKRGEFTFTPQFINVNSESNINGFNASDSKFSFKIANIGFVQSNYNADKSGFKGWAWGIAYNRLADFNSKEYIYGPNEKTSMLDFFRNRSHGINPNNLIGNNIGAALAYDCQLLLDDDGNNNYYNAHDEGWYQQTSSGYGELQKNKIKTKGGHNSWDFAFSGNVNDIFYFGASLGIETLRYKSTNIYKEDASNLNHIEYNYWEYKRNFEINAVGINLKTGVIVKPVNFLRFGAAIHTPTWFGIEDKFYATMKTEYKNGDYLTYMTENDKYGYDPLIKYNLQTPFKAIASAAFIAPGVGLLSFDYEYVDYSLMKFETEDFEDDGFEDVNNVIKEYYRPTHNFRLGGEVKVNPLISLRAGYAIYGNPDKTIDRDFERQIISGGVGFGDEDFFFDLTGSYHLYKTTKLLYEDQFYNIKNKYLYITMTFGFRF